MKKTMMMMLVLGMNGLAHAECYGTYKQNKWKTICGEVPAPGPKYRVPTTANALNQNDKSYLCSLSQLSEDQCSKVEFLIVSSGIIGNSGEIKFGLDVRMILDKKQCAATVWKTYQNDNTWVLSSPTSILGFPNECEFP